MAIVAQGQISIVDLHDIPGTPGFGYTLNIKGGTRGVAYAANGTNPEPKTSSQFSVELLKNGVKVANPASISWTCGGNLSGSSSAATFTPTIKSTYNSESSYVRVSVKEFSTSLAVEETIPIICTKHADGLDWINEWNNKYVQVGTEKIITPKIFAGTKSSSNELTGVAIGRDVLGGNANKVIGIVGYKKNIPVFSLDQDANFFVSSSGSVGDIKNGTNNAKGLYFDGSNLYISGKVKVSGDSTIPDSALSNTIKNGASAGTSAQTTLSNNSTNWTNAYNRVNDWAYGAVTGATTIDGGKIAANTITAEKIAVGDFNNYATVSELNPATMLPSSHFGGTKIVSPNSTTTEIAKTNSSNDYLMLSGYIPTPFVVNDELLISFRAYNCLSEDKAVTFTVWYYDANKKYLNGNNVAITLTGRTWKQYEVSLKLTSIDTNVRYVTIGFRDSNGTDLRVRNPRVVRKSMGKMIVDGTIEARHIKSDVLSASTIVSTINNGTTTISGGKITSGTITTNHIHTNGLNANVIKAGTISADRLDANTIVSKVNGGTTEINGNRIQTGTLSASKITTGTLDANKVNVTNIKAGNIVSGTIDASKISVTNLNASNIKSGTIDASKISVTNLNASNITSGTLGGGYNLLKNSKGKNGTTYWLSNGGGINIDSDATFGTCMWTTAPKGFKHSEAIKLKNNTEYVYEGYIFSRTAISGSATTPLHFWCMSTANASGQSQLTVLDYRQAVPTVNKWTKCYVHFRTASSGDVYFTPFVCVGGSTTFDFWATELSLSESSVESKWTPHPSEIYEGSTIIDASGVTINNGALKVKNKSGTTVLSGDSNGNLVLSGTLKSEASNGLYASLSSGGLTLRDSQKSEEVLRLNTSSFASLNRDINGVSFAMPQYSDFIRFSHIAKPSLESGWSSSNTQYNFMDFWSSKQNIGDNVFEKGINVYSPMYINDSIKFKYSGGSQYTNDITSASWNGVIGLLGVYGDNGAVLGFQNGSSLAARIIVTEFTHPGTTDYIKSWGNWNLGASTIHNGTFAGSHVNSYSNSVTRTYTSTYCIESEDKQVRVNFENIQITDGKAIINIPNKYVGINNGYIVSSIVKKGKGDVWVAKETENRFTLEATDDIKVNVEIIIKLEESASYELKTVDDTQLCIDMSTGQPILNYC